MTEEEKKEFEEFLAWKKQKKEQEDKGQMTTAPVADNSVMAPSKDNNDSQAAQGDNTKPTTDNPQKKDNTDRNIILGVLVVVIVLIIIIVAANSNNTDRNSSSLAPAVDSDTVVVDNSQTTEEYSSENNASQPEGWTRKEETDPMNDSKSVFVSISSDNFNDVGAPYGEVFTTITVRHMKKYGTDVMIQTSGGQIFGSEYEDNNYVTIRFDSNKPIRFYFNEASDASSDVVFLRKTSAFIQNAKKAKKITVEIPYFQAGRQVFTYTAPKPLEW